MGGVPGDVAVCLSRHVAVAPAVTGPDYLPIDPPSPGRKEVFTAVYLQFTWCLPGAAEGLATLENKRHSGTAVRGGLGR